MLKRYKIIVASILAGSGHNTAADLFAQVLSKNPNFEVIRFIHPSKSIDNSYNEMTKNSPIVHNFFVKHSPDITSDAITLSMIHFADECIELVKKEKPDCVITTHFTLSQWFKIAQWVTKLEYINITCFLDYGKRIMGELPYNLYIRPDYSVVFDKESYSSVIEKTKQRRDHIIVTGYRAKDEFLMDRSKAISRQEAKVKLKEIFKGPMYDQISTEKVSILIASGGGGIIQKTKGFLKKIAQYQKRDISLIDKFQFFIVCGQNEKYYKTIIKLRKTRLSWQNIIPFQWMSPEEYKLLQKSSDYPVLYGIAPATMHELLNNSCVPLIIHRVRGDHELRNIEFVENRKVGKYIKKDSGLIKDIFSNKYFLKKEQYLIRAEELLKEENEKLTLFGETLLDIFPKKPMPLEKIYKADFKLKFFSYLLYILFMFILRLRKFIYKLTGIFPWILKKFPIES